MGLSLTFLRQGMKVLHGGLHVQGLMGSDVVVEVLVLGEEPLGVEGGGAGAGPRPPLRPGASTAGGAAGATMPPTGIREENEFSPNSALKTAQRRLCSARPVALATALQVCVACVTLDAGVVRCLHGSRNRDRMLTVPPEEPANLPPKQRDGCVIRAGVRQRRNARRSVCKACRRNWRS